MTVLEFVELFPDEQSCRDDFKVKREKEGVMCKKCQSTAHYWLLSKEQWECKKCCFRTTLRSGSVMESSKLPVRTWYLAMMFMTFTKKGISAKELQRQLKYKRYNTIWALMHKIRNAMGNRENLYTIEGMVELDEGYFSIATPEGMQLKRGKGSQKKQNVAVMAESTFLEDLETGVISKRMGYVKMKVLENHKTEAINDVVEESIDEKSIVFTDKANTYLDIADYVEMHVSTKSTNETTATTLKWVHIAISNAKRTLLGIYRKIKGKYLQLYLDEFCYKLNRRYFGDRIFDRLTLAVAKSYW